MKKLFLGVLNLLICHICLAQSITWQQTKSGYTPTSIFRLDSALITIGDFSNPNCGYDRPMFISYAIATGDTNYCFEWSSDTCYNYFPSFVTGISKRSNFALSTGYLDGALNSATPGGIIKYNHTAWDTVLRLSYPTLNTIICSDTTYYLVSAINSMRVLQRRNLNTGAIYWTDTLPANSYLMQHNENTARLTLLTTSNATQGHDVVVLTYNAAGLRIVDDTIPYYPTNETVQLWGQSSNGAAVFSVKPTASLGRNRIVKYDASSGIYQEVNGVTSTIIDDGFITEDGNYMFYIGKDGLTANSTFHIYKADLNLNTVVDSFAKPNLVSIISEIDGRNGYLFLSQSLPSTVGRAHHIGRYTYSFNSIDSITIIDSVNNTSQGELIAITPDAVIYSTGFGGMNASFYRIAFPPLATDEITSICANKFSVLTPQFWDNLNSMCQPKTLTVFDIMGKNIYENNLPVQLNYKPNITGIYFIQVLFENGEVKREKVFLTAN
jgi:hypothetical protein